MPFEFLNGILLESRSEEHTSELQSQSNIVCRLLLEKKKSIFMIQTRQQILITSVMVAANDTESSRRNSKFIQEKSICQKQAKRKCSKNSFKTKKINQDNSNINVFLMLVDTIYINILILTSYRIAGGCVQNFSVR